jgi:acyl carrier protein
MRPVPAQEVEAALATFPGIKSVTVVEYDAEATTQCTVAYAESGGQRVDISTLQAHARKLLPGYLMPAAIIVLDRIPVTSGGAVDFEALPVPDLGGLVPYKTPGTARQETLCVLFAESLGVARCGLDTDFFKLGGRSVDAMLLAGRINSELGIKISIADLFKAPTPGDLDKRLDLVANSGK